MDIFQAIVLALLQGLTEFLPISSSAHLIFPKEILAWPDQGLAFDVAVHVGTLLAVVYYFRSDIFSLSTHWFNTLKERQMNREGYLAWMILMATLPVCLAGLLFAELIATQLRSIAVISATTIGFALLLAYADKRHKPSQSLKQITVLSAIIIGCAQALALIPGTSRSGITITAALLLGFSRDDAARFSFLLSIPVILLSGAHESAKLLGDEIENLHLMALAVLVSAVSAYLCIHFFLSFINRIGMMPFVYYRLALGTVLIILVFLS